MADIAIAIRDPTYLLDFIQTTVVLNQDREQVTDFIISELKKYAEIHMEKIMGLAMPRHIAGSCKSLCSRLWSEIDIIPLVLPESKPIDHFNPRQSNAARAWDTKTLDEQAESMARKSVRFVKDRRNGGSSNADPCADCLVRKTSPCCKSV